MYLVYPEHFKSDIHIPNLEEVCLQNVLIRQEISRYEMEFLKETLGICLTELLLNSLEYSAEQSKWVFKSNAEDRFKWLVNGYIYDTTNITSHCGCDSYNENCPKKEWEGIVKVGNWINPTTNEVEEFTEVSIIAYYVYINWRTIYRTTTEQVGESSMKSDTLSPSVIGWFEKYHHANRWLWNAVQGQKNNSIVSLYTFLENNKELYPEWNGGVCLGSEPNAWSLT